MKKGRIFIGTSGWHYDHWLGPFYPRDLNKKDMLSFYADSFDTAEINNSFYQLPKKQTLRDWKNKTPENFIFAIKGSRYITHMKKLKDPEKSVPNFLDVAESLNKKFGPVLFQLPPRWKANPERLRDFLNELPEKYRYTFEFRDESWFTNEIYELLSQHNAAFCIYQIEGRSSPYEVTADFVYIRLHGPAQQAYQGQYSDKTLKSWAKRISRWNNETKDVYCYFDNDQAGFAPQDAMRLKKMCEG